MTKQIERLRSGPNRSGVRLFGLAFSSGALDASAAPMAKQIAPRAKYLVMVIVIFIFVFSLGAFGFFFALSLWADIHLFQVFQAHRFVS